MKTPDLSDARSRHRLIAVLAAAVTVLVLTGIGVYGLITGPPTSNEPDSAEESRPGPVVTVPSDPLPTRTSRLPVVRPSADPETFAGNVATALFSWDTASGFMPLDYTAVVLEVGDPSGAEQAGLAADIATYLPSREAWTELRQYGTAQHLTIDNVYVPEAWADGVGPGPAGAARRGNDCVHDRGHPPPRRGLERRDRPLRASSGVHRVPRLRADLRHLPSAAAVPARQPPALNGIGVPSC